MKEESIESLIAQLKDLRVPRLSTPKAMEIAGRITCLLHLVYEFHKDGDGHIPLLHCETCGLLTRHKFLRDDAIKVQGAMDHYNEIYGCPCSAERRYGCRNKTHPVRNAA